jgi:hypothetical protein
MDNNIYDIYDEERGYEFLFSVSNTDSGEDVSMMIDNVHPYSGTELRMFLDVYERFLKAVSFVLDGKHLELVDD